MLPLILKLGGIGVWWVRVVDLLLGRTIKGVTLIRRFKGTVRRSKRMPPDGYFEFIKFWHDTYSSWQKDHMKYFMTQIDGAASKRLLKNYGLFPLMALAKLYFERSWDFVSSVTGKGVRVARSIQHFQTRVTVLLEEDWKPIAEKLEKEVSNKDQMELQFDIKPFPKKEDSQANKVAISRAMEGEK